MSIPSYDEGWVRTEAAPKLPPPPSTTGIAGWVSTNLFPSWWQGLLTVFGVLVLGWIVWDMLVFTVIKANFIGADREACLATITPKGEKPGFFGNLIGSNEPGACWAYVWAKFGQFVYGLYPFEARWRPNICYFVGAVALVPMMMPSLPYKRENAIFLLLVYPILVFILLSGGNLDIGAGAWTTFGIFMGVLAAAFLFLSEVAHILERDLVIKVWLAIAVILGAILFILGFDFGLTYVETAKWGGLMVTLVVAVTGIVASLPLGILLALGRRSSMPVVKLFSVVFIEVWRGVPLITVLFMASVMLPLFLPEGVTFDKLLRALIGTALFSGAYMAEVVRGGLQAIPKGQYEAASALGLSFWRSMGLIILPQALKIVIPGIVNNFIGLFKDTTLVSIIGIFDVLGIVNLSFSDPEWSSPVTAPTGYLTAALIFFVFCFAMSRYSMFMERLLHTGHKR